MRALGVFLSKKGRFTPTIKIITYMCRAPPLGLLPTIYEYSCIVKIHVSSRSRIFLISLVYLCMYLYIYLCVSRLLAKRKTIQTWNLAHILPLTLSKNGFLVFSIKSPWRPLASKNCRVTWIFRITPRLPCFFVFIDFLVKKWGWAI